MLEVKKISKSYSGVEVLKGVDLYARPGEIVGVLGPNGAGKTTLLEIIEGLIQADSGDIELDKIQLGIRRNNTSKSMAVVLQTTPLPPFMTAEELMQLFSASYSTCIKKSRELLSVVGLESKKEVSINTLSVGQKQRLGIALALAAEPDILFADEPSSALDPQARRIVWGLLKDYVASGEKTVILSTQHMDEAETLCTRVYLLSEGRIRSQGTPEEMVRENAPGCVISFQTSGELSDSLLKLENIEKTGFIDGLQKFEIIAKDGHEIARVMRVLTSDESVDVSSINIKRNTLEDVFIKLTGRSLRD
ncbi:ABC transporter ATP-binding protein [Teredinibacter sp. KSP-S5-2]|uniref:ABC transporter ATP-binding protein n=1 Tax=Teredinibacter sp. KSP-S5-2 TaxID=3034506 RepID=UPI002934B1D1|nr:ABC transporter ATP-binding protein [Teredinibacter sp. KSP-S5-2]WNO11293.1 ABC transporter ATP-binding protein [Teredinibacter sp. KSP-S5-2]